MTPVVPHFSNTRRAGDFVFVSDQLPFTAPGEIVEGDIEEQSSQCLKNIDAALTVPGARVEIEAIAFDRREA